MTKSANTLPRRTRRDDDYIIKIKGSGKFAEIAECKPIDGRTKPMRERSRLITAFSDRLGGWNQLDLLQKEIIKRLATMALNSQLAELEMFANPQKVTNENRLSFSTAQSNFDRLARSIGLIKDHKISVKDQKKIDAAAATANMRAYAAKANAEAAARGDTAAAKIIARVAAEDAAAAAKATAAKTTEVAEL